MFRQIRVSLYSRTPVHPSITVSPLPFTSSIGTSVMDSVGSPVREDSIAAARIPFFFEDFDKSAPPCSYIGMVMFVWYAGGVGFMSETAVRSVFSKRLFLSVGAVILFLILFLHPEASAAVITDSMRNFCRQLVPVLFPYMVLSHFFCVYGLLDPIAPLFPIGRLFGMGKAIEF